MKLLTPELLILAQMCTKSFVGLIFAPDPTVGTYSAPPDPLPALRGLLLRGGGGREGRGGWVREGRGGEGRAGEGNFASAPSKYIWIDAAAQKSH